MKTGTDAVLLGSWADVDGAARILDIGTGSGILSLMMAQRSAATIDAVEIDAVSARVAALNVAKSPWAERIHVIHTPFEQHVATTGNKYDVIISNPPFFRHSLRTADPVRCRARHDDELPACDLMRGVKKLLAPGGRIYLVFPSDDLHYWKAEAIQQELYCRKITHVISRAGKQSFRILACFANEPVPFSENTLTIHDAGGSYTEEYRQLTADFYLAF